MCTQYLHQCKLTDEWRIFQFRDESVREYDQKHGLVWDNRWAGGVLLVSVLVIVVLLGVLCVWWRDFSGPRRTSGEGNSV